MLGGHEWHMFDKLIPEYPIVRAKSGTGTASTRGPVDRRVMVFNGRNRHYYNSALRYQWDEVTIDTNIQTTGYYVNLRQWSVKSDSEYIKH
jgi:hypothetical protein